MERLRHSDYRRLLDFVAGLQEPVGREGFGSHIIRLASELLPGATIAFDQINESSNHYSLDHNVPLDLADQAKVHARLQEGKRNSEIGIILGCSPRTIDKHVQNILRKTGSETRTAAVRNGRVG